MKKKSKDAYIVSGGKDKKKSTNKNKKRPKYFDLLDEAL